MLEGCVGNPLVLHLLRKLVHKTVARILKSLRLASRGPKLVESSAESWRQDGTCKGMTVKLWRSVSVSTGVPEAHWREMVQTPKPRRFVGLLTFPDVAQRKGYRVRRLWRLVGGALASPLHPVGGCSNVWHYVSRQQATRCNSTAESLLLRNLWLQPQARRHRAPSTMLSHPVRDGISARIPLLSVKTLHGGRPLSNDRVSDRRNICQILCVSCRFI